MVFTAPPLRAPRSGRQRPLRRQSGRRARISRLAALVAGFALGALRAAAAQEPVLQTETLPATIRVIRSQHARLSFGPEIRRIAVGDPTIASAELVTSREVLVLGRESGRTTMLVWFTDGSLREYLIVVQRDLSVLQAALRTVHPNISVEAAPDRDALVLTGTVPDIGVSQAAEGVARTYLQAGERQRAGVSLPQIQAPQPPSPVPVPGAPPPETPAPPAPQTAQPPPAAGGPGQPGGAAVQLPAEPLPPSGSVINLLRLETLPPLPEEKLRQAAVNLNADGVIVRRILRGAVRNDADDVFVLEGSIPNQVALVRLLNVAAQILTGQATGEGDIRVVADEAGALSGVAQGAGAGGSQSGGLGSLGGSSGGAGFGSQAAGRLTNQIMRNLGRAKVIEAAGGRILSFIDVADLPQVRINLRIYEINRAPLQQYTPDLAVLSSNFRQGPLSPPSNAVAVQGDNAAGVDKGQVQNVLSFLGGSLIDWVQFSTGRFAVDAALTLLERDSIARNLANPALTVLSGEPAVFQVGGEVPVATGFSPAFGTPGAGAGLTPGVFTFIDFIPFGVVLQVRPLVGDDDIVTLDVVPQIVTPDATLTQQIRQTSGTNPATTAFETRSLRTSARLQDGEALLVGGLTSRNMSDVQNKAPGAGDLPGIGWLFKGSTRSDDGREIVVVINPAIVRDRRADTALWAFPGAMELTLPFRGGGRVTPR
jgi:Flp pilus assembly secretin CpaC